MVAAEYDDRWRLASARAAADGLVVVAALMTGAQAAAPAAAAAAALGLTLADDAAAACAAAAAHAASSAVDLTVESSTAQRVRLRTADGAAAVASAEHLGRRRPSAGQRCVPSFSTPTH